MLYKNALFLSDVLKILHLIITSSTELPRCSANLIQRSSLFHCICAYFILMLSPLFKIFHLSFFYLDSKLLEGNNCVSVFVFLALPTHISSHRQDFRAFLLQRIFSSSWFYSQNQKLLDQGIKHPALSRHVGDPSKCFQKGWELRLCIKEKESFT